MDNPLSVTDPNGVVTTYAYDGRRRVTSQAVGGRPRHSSTGQRACSGRSQHRTLPTALYTYDAAHRLIRVSDATGGKVDFTLDAMGNRTVEEVKDVSNNVLRSASRVYDSLNRLNKVIGAANTYAVTTTFGYDDEGNQTAASAPWSRYSPSAYDELSPLDARSDPISGKATLGYDDRDSLISVIDPKGLETGYEYNGFGDLLSVSSPDTGITSNTYDSAGNLATSEDARAVTATYAHDALNRVTSVGYGDQTIAFTYDAGTYGKGIDGALRTRRIR